MIHHNKINAPAIAVCLSLLLTAFSSTPTYAFQSGSRGPSRAAAPRSAPASSVLAPSFNSPSQSFSAPVQSFSTPPQSFGAPVQSFDSNQGLFVEPFQSQSFAGQSFAQPMPGQQFSNPSFAGQTSPQGFAGQSFSGMPSTAMPDAASSGSLGIPAAGVTDPIFEINNPYSQQRVDHCRWDHFLSRYLVTDQQGLNRIYYSRVTAGDRQMLQCYLSDLQSVDVRTLNRAEQMAYWFNLYNAKTVDIVLANYPIRSIRQVKEKLTDFVGPFDDAGAVTVLGKPLSLTDIESGILRPVYNDPRIHYAINCASFGCPNLPTSAWTADNLDNRLNAAAYDYINSDRGFKSGLWGLRLSKIFKWYKDDFGGSDATIIAHMQQYASPATFQKLQNANGRIAGYFYDWSLNDARIQRRRLLEPLIR